MSDEPPTSAQNIHQFGGEWTQQKLDILKGYLAAHGEALKHKPFKRIYIDAFAGAGYRTDSVGSASAPSVLQLLEDSAEAEEAQALLDGSAHIALQTEPPFDHYAFIDTNSAHISSLEQLSADFPERSISLHHEDANTFIQRLCARGSGYWRTRRAVLFLDPYGAQVDWATIQAIANTQAIDMWLLFPLGVVVNRLLTRSGEIPETWRNCLNRLLGGTDWYDAFYRVERVPTLFGDDAEHVVKASLESIGAFFHARLESIFSGVAEPRILRNSNNTTLYMLFFTASNPRGAVPALRIANHLLSDKFLLNQQRRRR